MTEEQRRNTTLEETEDVPRENQIESYNQAQAAKGEGLYDGLKLPFNPDELRTESGRSIENAEKAEMLLTPDGSPNLGIIPESIGKNKEFPAGRI